MEAKDIVKYKLTIKRKCEESEMTEYIEEMKVKAGSVKENEIVNFNDSINRLLLILKSSKENKNTFQNIDDEIK